MLSMNESLELAVFSDAVSRLETAGIDYMLTGSVAMPENGAGVHLFAK